MLNTPPTFGIYIAGLIFEWLKREGGLEVIGERNRRKAALLYDFIDASGYYRSPVARTARSWMNVPFTIRRWRRCFAVRPLLRVWRISKGIVWWVACAPRFTTPCRCKASRRWSRSCATSSNATAKCSACVVASRPRAVCMPIR